LPKYHYKLAWVPGNGNPALLKFVQLVRQHR
jgi:hypothetical protein